MSDIVFNFTTTAGANAFDFSADSDGAHVVAGGVAYSALGYGIDSSHDFNALLNDGAISGLTDGVHFSGHIGGTITNNAGAYIVGTEAISAEGNGTSIINHGAMIGLSQDGINFHGAADDFTLANDGMIHARGTAVSAASVDGTISNSGLIESTTGIGIGFIGLAGLSTTIDNTATGVIRGYFAAISAQGSLATFSLDNHGTLYGGIIGGAGNEHIINTGHIHGTVSLGYGDDVFKGKGGTSAAVLGEAGNDRLIGGKTADHLSGGDGFDTLTGGPGKDHFIFNAALDASTNVDRVTDFTHFVDKIDLSHAIFTKVNAHGVLKAGMFHVGAAAHDANDHIVYNPANGWLTYDGNGSAVGGATHFATLAAHLTLANTDFVVVA